MGIFYFAKVSKVQLVVKGVMHPQLLFIYANRPIQLALRRTYPYCRIVSQFSDLISCSDRDTILFQIHSEKEIQSFLWEKIRLEWEMLSPIIVIGCQQKNKFFSNPVNQVFLERSYEYRYLSLPLSLSKLLHALTSMQPIYDKLTLKSHIKRYASIEGLVRTYLHHIDNYLYRNALQNCIAELKKVQLLLVTGGYRGIDQEMIELVRNPINSRVQTIKLLVSEIIDEK